jgi:hypothetical protein
MVMDQYYFARIVQITDQVQRGQLPSLDDVRLLIDRCRQTDKRILEVIDLLAMTRPTSRSKHIDRARTILEELL